jgi:RNA polymerase sigma factor (sigma-70 family)
MSQQDHQITEVIVREESRLRNFIRKWVPQEADAEDILQDVFYELIEAQRMVAPLREAGAWMFRVARNRIADLFRKRGSRREDPLERAPGPDAPMEEWLPSREAGPEAAYARAVLLEQLDAAMEELPENQRAVFMAHELEGISFKELSAATGVAVNTLISRKHYAVLHLRRRLRAIYKEYSND